MKILKELREAKNLTSFTINPALETLAPALENKGGESRPSAPPRRPTLLHSLDSTLRLFTLVCGDVDRQGKNCYLDCHYLSASDGGLKLEGNGPVYALKSELAAKKGIHEAGVEKAAD